MYLAEGFPRLFTSMAASRLEPKRVMFVHGRKDKKASNILVQAVKNGNPGLVVDPPLILYDQGQNMTGQAIEFCPWFKCNAG